MFKKKKKHYFQKKKEPRELVDPVLYIGGLAAEKYPSLSQEEKDTIDGDVENPLNKRT